jgi:AcrR family transcriptional regulator
LLPPGRHGLPQDFVRTNQRWRLFAALASSIAERGYRATRIDNICAGAAVSRRTFYEHFEGRQAVGPALVGFASTTALAHLEDAEPDSGWATLIIEVVAAAFGGEMEAARAARRAEDVLRALIEHIAGRQSSETKAAAA